MIDGNGVKQHAYADDIGALLNTQGWWSNIEEHGRSFENYQKAPKYWLFVKEDK